MFNNSSLPPVSAGRKKFAGQPIQDYFIHGTVVHGTHLGKTLGFPTANIEPRKDQSTMIPNGVYLVSVQLEERKFFGLCNIGIRPTVGGTHLVIEVNILDFSENIYGKEISIMVIRTIRKEKKFKNLDRLVNQIKLDKKKALKILSTLDKDQSG